MHEEIDPLFAIIVSMILSLIFVVTLLVNARRAKVRRDKARRRKTWLHRTEELLQKEVNDGYSYEKQPEIRSTK